MRPFFIDDWVANGLMTREAILKTLTERMESFCCLSEDEEHPQLRKTFDSLCVDENRTRKITQPIFISFLQTTGFLPPSMAEAGAFIYRSLLYLSQAPFYGSAVESLTQDNLFRAIVQAHYERSSRADEEGNMTRSRTPGDTQRLLFQSVATTRDGKYFLVNTDEARKQAERRAFDLPEFNREYSQTNYDEDGDEMFHDLLDTLYNVHEHRIPDWFCVPRDRFRTLAKMIRRDGKEELRDLSISQDDFRAFVKLLLIAHVGRPLVQAEYSEELDQISDCIVRSFAQFPNLGITWDMFEQASHATPAMFMGLHRLLSSFYTPLEKLDSQDIPTKAGHIATRPILSQLGLIISQSENFEYDYFEIYRYYDITKSEGEVINIAKIAEDMTAAEDPIIVLISGKITQTNEKTIFGYYLPFRGHGEHNEMDPCLLFQLSPIHDVFRGDNAGRPGWEIGSGQSLTFGKKDEGVALVLEEDCKRATLFHNISGNGLYEPTAWRGTWQADVQIEEIEVWVE